MHLVLCLVLKTCRLYTQSGIDKIKYYLLLWNRFFIMYKQINGDDAQ